MGREIAAWIEKVFEAKVPVETIVSRAKRIKDAAVSNETPEPTTENQSETGEIQDHPQHGGAREGWRWAQIQAG